MWWQFTVRTIRKKMKKSRGTSSGSYLALPLRVSVYGKDMEKMKSTIKSVIDHLLMYTSRLLDINRPKRILGDR